MPTPFAPQPDPDADPDLDPDPDDRTLVQTEGVNAGSAAATAEGDDAVGTPSRRAPAVMDSDPDGSESAEDAGSADRP